MNHLHVNLVFFTLMYLYWEYQHTNSNDLHLLHYHIYANIFETIIGHYPNFMVSALPKSLSFLISRISHLISSHCRFFSFSLLTSFSLSLTYKSSPNADKKSPHKILPPQHLDCHPRPQGSTLHRLPLHRFRRPPKLASYHL